MASCWLDCGEGSSLDMTERWGVGVEDQRPLLAGGSRRFTVNMHVAAYFEGLMRLTISILATLVLVTEASAHHSRPAQYNMDGPIELTGVITGMDWINPIATFI